MRRRISGVLLSAALAAILAGTPSFARASGSSFLGQFNHLTTVASTVPANGDLNPYGTAVVPHTIGNLVQGDVLISNFNNSANLQGTGTTIVQIAPNGAVSLFAQISPTLPYCPGGVGLTTALSILPHGYVVVGSLPTTDGMSGTAGQGCLIVLNSSGAVSEVFSNPYINGPWDMTEVDGGPIAELFVTNVLNGTVANSPNVVNQGTVLRLILQTNTGGAPRLLLSTIIGSGFPERTDPNALVVGPTGLGLTSNGTLYVADTQGNRIAAIPGALFRFSSAGTGITVTSGGALNNPLGLAIAPNNNILTVNANDGLVVETAPSGPQVKTFDTGFGGGSLFGLAVAPGGNGIYLVDDGNNTLAFLGR